jgi:hypothetical protein
MRLSCGDEKYVGVFNKESAGKYQFARMYGSRIAVT